MHEVHLRNVDLNLLHPLRALLEERHVTRAAKRCFLSQSAMSRALDRLRETLGDPLLVRTGRTYERTVRGERVLGNWNRSWVDSRPCCKKRNSPPPEPENVFELP